MLFFFFFSLFFQCFIYVLVHVKDLENYRTKSDNGVGILSLLDLWTLCE